MKTRLRPRQLEALHEVVRQGSMTRASRHLGVSQPAVSRLLTDLSADLGFALFERRDGRLTPTPEVRVLLPDIGRLMDLLDRISETSRNLNERKAGTLRIACLPGFAVSHLPRVLAAFLRDRPGITATIEPDRPERILEWMVGEQFDLGITDGFEFLGHPAVEREQIDIRVVCVFPDTSPLARLDIITPRELADARLIHTRPGTPYFRLVENAFSACDVPMPSYIEARQFTTACELICEGVGVAVLSELDALRYRGRGLDFRPFRPAIPHRLSLVRPVHKQPSMITLEFMEMFIDSLRPFEFMPEEDTG